MKELIIPSNVKLINKWHDLERLFVTNHFVNEQHLMLTKWGDYLEYHPVNADIIFFEAYRYCYRWYHSRYFDYEESTVKRGAKEESLFENTSGVIQAIHDTRKIADEIGMPYGYFCSYYFKIAIKQYLWQHIPLTTQMRVNHLVEAVKQEWLEMQNTFKMVPESQYLWQEEIEQDYIKTLFETRELKNGNIQI